MAISAIPKGYHAVTPYLIIEGATKAIEFYKQAFAAELVMQMPLPDGGVAHAEIKIADSHIMLSDMCPDVQFKSPHQLGGTPVSIMLYVEDVDAVFANALSLGERAAPSSRSVLWRQSWDLRRPFWSYLDYRHTQRRPQ